MRVIVQLLVNIGLSQQGVNKLLSRSFEIFIPGHLFLLGHLGPFRGR